MARDLVTASVDNFFANSGLGISGYPISMSMLADPSAQNANYSGMYLGSDDTHYDRLMWRGDVTNDPVRADSRRDATTVTADKTDFTIGAFQHGGVTFDTASRIAYYEGVAGTATTTSLADGGISRNLFRVGASFITAANSLAGPVAEIAIWNVVLEAVEMAALSMRFSALLIRPSALVGYWPFLGAANDTADERPFKGEVSLTKGGSSPNLATHPRIIMPQGMF